MSDGVYTSHTIELTAQILETHHDIIIGIDTIMEHKLFHILEEYWERERTAHLDSLTVSLSELLTIESEGDLDATDPKGFEKVVRVLHKRP